MKVCIIRLHAGKQSDSPLYLPQIYFCLLILTAVCAIFIAFLVYSLLKSSYPPYPPHDDDDDPDHVRVKAALRESVQTLRAHIQTAATYSWEKLRHAMNGLVTAAGGGGENPDSNHYNQHPPDKFIAPTSNQHVVDTGQDDLG